MVSVIIPVAARVDLAEATIKSVRANTKMAHEIRIVQNGVGLDLVRKMDYDELICGGDTPMGYPWAINMGARGASGDYLCLLNSDTEVMTPGWLEILTRDLDTLPDAAIVSPVTDFISIPYQHVGTCLENVVQINRLAFVCVVIRREWWDKVGNLDERFGLGNWEDNDYCERVTRAGGKLYVDPRVFIHHVGHATHDAIMSRQQFGELLQHNRQLFEEKWSQSTA